MISWCSHFITVTPEWARWRLQSPASRLFTQPLFRRRSKKRSKLPVTGLCEGYSPLTGEFTAQRASYPFGLWQIAGTMLTEPLFKQLHLLNVKDIFDVQCMKCCYKFVSKELPNYSVTCLNITMSFMTLGAEVMISFTYTPPAQAVLVPFGDIIYWNYWIHSPNI